MDAVKKWSNEIFETPTLISVIAGCSLVLWQQWTGSLSPSVQITFFTLFIFLTGIPHGAIDHLVEKETAKRQQKNFHLTFFLLKYLLTMVFYSLMWYIFPSVSLLFFLLMSAGHFGETDIEKAPPTILWNITRFSFGCFVLLWLLLFHAFETTPVLERISQNNTSVMLIWSAAVKFTTPLLISLALFTVALFYFANKKSAIYFETSRFLRLWLILVLTYFLPLLPAFALYFGGWHALCSFQTIHNYLLDNKEGSKNTLQPHSIMAIWTKTLLFTFLALMILTFAVWYWLHFLQTWDPLPLLFIFLSLITLPHLNVMHRMNKMSI